MQTDNKAKAENSKGNQKSVAAKKGDTKVPKAKAKAAAKTDAKTKKAVAKTKKGKCCFSSK